MPKPIDRNFAGDGYGCSMDHFADCGPTNVMPTTTRRPLVDNHSRAALVIIGVKPSPGDFGNIIIHADHVQTMRAGLSAPASFDRLLQRSRGGRQ